MSKHQEILDYLEKLPIGKRVSVRSISNFLNVSDGTAYRAIKEAEKRGSGVIAVNGKMVDRPVVIRAQRTIDLALASGIISKEDLQ